MSEYQENYPREEKDKGVHSWLSFWAGAEGIHGKRQMTPALILDKSSQISSTKRAGSESEAQCGGEKPILHFLAAEQSPDYEA